MRHAHPHAVETGSGRTASVWMDTADLPRSPRLEKDLSAEVCVVGAGISDPQEE
jgi:hypothetical protein